MFKNIDSMMKSGAFNKFECSANDKGIVTFSDKKGIKLIVPIEENQLLKTITAYIDTPNTILEDSMSDYFNNHFTKNFNVSSVFKIVVKTRAHSNINEFKTLARRVEPIAQNGFKKLDFSLLEKDLVSAGFDVSKIAGGSKALATPTSRDYSKSIVNDEAISLLRTNEEFFKKMPIKEEDLEGQTKVAYEFVKYGNKQAVFFVGPAGTGKSVFCREIGYLLNAPVIQIQATDGLTADDLTGKAVVNTDEPVEGVSQSQFKYILGALLKAYIYGWIVIIDEVNMSVPQTLNIINTFSDKTPEIIIDGVVYKKHPNFVLLMTMNPGYAGTNELNDAMHSRGIVIEVPQLNEKQFVNRLDSYVTNELGKKLNNKFYKKLFNFNNEIQNVATSMACTADFCIRNAQDFVNGILITPRSKDEFKSIALMSYINHIMINSYEKQTFESYKSSDDFNKIIDALYEEYDYKISEDLNGDSLVDLSEMFASPEEVSSSSDSSIIDVDVDEEMNDLENFCNKETEVSE